MKERGFRILLVEHRWLIGAIRLEENGSRREFLWFGLFILLNIKIPWNEFWLCYEMRCWWFLYRSWSFCFPYHILKCAWDTWVSQKLLFSEDSAWIMISRKPLALLGFFGLMKVPAVQLTLCHFPILRDLFDKIHVSKQCYY